MTSYMCHTRDLYESIDLKVPIIYIFIHFTIENSTENFFVLESFQTCELYLPNYV